MPLILEGILTTRNPDGSRNVAPMGPIAHVLTDRRVHSLTFRPFPESTTCRNLLAHQQGVFHVTDQTLLFAQAVTSRRELSVPLVPAQIVDVDRLQTCCRWYEFRVTSSDTSGPRTVIETEILHSEQAGEWLGFNRAQAAVIEAAILATRLHLLPRCDVEQQLQALQIIIEKTAAPDDERAFDLIHQFVRQHYASSPVDEPVIGPALSAKQGPL